MIKHLKKGQPIDSKQKQNQSVRDIVENILAHVETEGDAAIREYSEKLDNWTPESFKLSEDEIKACYTQLDEQLINDIKWAQSQVRNFAQIQRDSMKDVEVETLPGVTLGHKHIAMDS
ncbi:histidinol dehydrogenase, partial [Pseudoalteromonas sp. TB51]